MKIRDYYNSLGTNLFLLSSLTHDSDFYTKLSNFISKHKQYKQALLIPNNLICFEGERCTGKDTIIEKLGQQCKFDYNPIKKRIIVNDAWLRLNENKQNCYFSMKDPIQSILLWYSDLSFRLKHWEITDDNHVYFINRYVLSVRVCLNSIFANLTKDKIFLINNILDELENLLPRPYLTIILDISPDVEYQRIISKRGVILNRDEKDIMINNTRLFRTASGKSICHVDSNKNIKYVFDSVYKIINNKVNKKGELLI